MLDRIRIVLVGTSHSGNIGSAARAMKVMGLTNMVLVAPECEVDGQAIALAAGASDIATNARIVSTLDEAISDCGLVIGSSARSRTLEWPMLEPREAGVKAIEEASTHPIAFIFGRERVGLTNEELQKCHFHVCIPANPEYSSLNLAMAVQTISYEARVAWLDSQAYKGESKEEKYPLNYELELFYDHLNKVMIETDFINEEQPGLVMNKMRRMFNRARPEINELRTLRGILTAVEKSIKAKNISN